MNKNITLYRYCLSFGSIESAIYKVVKETEKCYFCEGNKRFLKTDEEKADIKSRENYPYIDYFSTKKVTRKQAVEEIKRFFTKCWGLR